MQCVLAERILTLAGSKDARLLGIRCTWVGITKTDLNVSNILQGLVKLGLPALQLAL